jgi:hypothetical protein
MGVLAPDLSREKRDAIPFLRSRALGIKPR